MSEDFEIEFCPKCGSSKVQFQFDEIHQIRTFLHCDNCNYIEAHNPDPEPPEDTKPWENDPDFWKK